MTLPTVCVAITSTWPLGASAVSSPSPVMRTASESLTLYLVAAVADSGTPSGFMGVADSRTVSHGALVDSRTA